MGSFLPASTLDTFFIFLALFFSLPLCFFFLPLFFFWFSMTGQNKGNRNLEEMAVSSLCYHTTSHFLFFFVQFTHFFCRMCVAGLSTYVVLGKTKWWHRTIKREKQKKKESERVERGRPLKELELQWKIFRLASSNWYILDSGHSTLISLVL